MAIETSYSKLEKRCMTYVTVTHVTYPQGKKNITLMKEYFH